VHVNAAAAALVAALCRAARFPARQASAHNVLRAARQGSLVRLVRVQRGGALGANAWRRAFTNTMFAPVRRSRSDAAGSLPTGRRPARLRIVVGLVAVTAAGFRQPVSALLLGAVAASDTRSGAPRRGWMMPTSSAHGVGAQSTLLTGVLAEVLNASGTALSGNPRQLAVQAVAVGAVIVWRGESGGS
jgi:ammonia channel protein AmtB